MLKKKRQIAPRLTNTAVTFLHNNFKNINAGSSYILESIPAIFKQTVSDLRKKFSENEMEAMAACLWEVPLYPAMAGQILLTKINNLFTDDYENKIKCDINKLVKKINELSLAEIYFLEIYLKGSYVNMEKIEEWRKREEEMNEWIDKRGL